MVEKYGAREKIGERKDCLREELEGSGADIRVDSEGQ